MLLSLDGNGGGVVDLRSTLQSVQGNNPRSIYFMLQTTVTTDSNILFTGSNPVSNLFGVCINCAGVASGILVIDMQGGYYYRVTGKVVNDGLWHTVLVTYDGTTLSIYVDGKLDSSTTNWNGASTATIASTLNTLGNSENYLGQKNWPNGRWPGKLKNVIFYDYVITNTYALANSYQAAGSILYNSCTLLIFIKLFNIYIYTVLYI